MNLEKYCEDLKIAVDYINGADIDEHLRKIIRRALMSELDRSTENLEEELKYERQGSPYTDEDKKMIIQELEGKVAKTWDEERSNLLALALKLRRKERSVKAKAIALGFQSAVDYWANRGL